MFYEDVFRKLGERKVKYVVAGGTALVLHGVVRFTAVLDIIVALSKNNLEKFISCINELGFKPRVPVHVKEPFLSEEKINRWKEFVEREGVVRSVHSELNMLKLRTNSLTIPYSLSL
jgi:hypothetical protein